MRAFRWLLAAALVLVVLAVPLVAQDAPPDVEGQFNLLLAGLLGLGSTLFTNIGKRVVVKIAGADAAITKFYKKVQPLVAMALGFILPLIAVKIPGVELPTGEVLANAPLGTLTFIGLRELYQHFFGSA